MTELDIDIECYSSVSLKDSGTYKYAESDDFEILLFGYSIDGGPVQVIDLAAGEELPDDIVCALTDDSVLKWAHNAAFERICLSEYINRQCGTKGYLSPISWRCSMIWAAYMGLPLSLDMVGQVLNLETKKMTEGKALIRYFCVPCAATKANGGRTRNYYYHDPKKWELFKQYNRRDVEVELAIKDKLKKFPVPDSIWYEWTQIDQPINDRGILIDEEMVKNAIAIDEKVSTANMARLKELTGLENPNSPLQIRGWLKSHGITTDSVDKKTIAVLLKDATPEVAEVLKLRQQIAKSSIKKYTTMINVACADHRARGCFQFAGAHTFRWAGRHIQLQNLYRNTMPDLEEARALVRDGNYEALSMLYDNIPNVLSELIRTAFVPPEGMKYIVADFSQIEARVLAYLAGEKWRLDLFKDPTADLYCASAENMFHVKVEKHGENAEYRQRAKIAELSLGYSGGVGALKSMMSGMDMQLPEEELEPLVHMWRAANPAIVAFWWDVDRAIKKTVTEHVETRVGKIVFSYKSGMLIIRLPSGRKMIYVRPHMGVNQFGSECVCYWGLDATKHFSEIRSYGPRYVENITQATSRDILVYAMNTLKDCQIVAHIHDEVLIEAPLDMTVKEVCDKMSIAPEWMRGLPLRAEGYECDFYMKD